MLKILLHSLLFCLLSTLLGAEERGNESRGTPAGVYIFKSNTSRSDSSARAGSYRSFSRRGAITTVYPSSGRSFEVTKFQSIQFLPHIDPYKHNVIRVSHLRGFKSTYNKYSSVYNKYSKARPYLLSQIDSMKLVVGRLESGEGYYKGRWMSDGSITRVIDNEKRKARDEKYKDALASWSTLSTKDGKSYKEVKVVKKTDTTISIDHTGGAAKINYKLLPASKVEEIWGSSKISKSSTVVLKKPPVKKLPVGLKASIYRTEKNVLTYQDSSE